MSQPRQGPSPAKLLVFRGFAVLIVCLVGAIGAEQLLVWRQARIGRNEVLDPGMVRYDAELGWKLEPGWTGRHRHNDFTVKYTVNDLGFRADTPYPRKTDDGRLTAVLGDSFVFGIGVNDDETFVHFLDAARPGGSGFVNAGVPGFSTDQQALLLEKHVFRLHPQQIILFVYLANDLFDNLRPMPLQVNSAKPFFELQDGALRLRNSPVSLEAPHRSSGDRSILREVLGPDPAKWPLSVRLEQSSEITRVLFQSLWVQNPQRLGFATRFAPALSLFDLLLERMKQDCANEKITLTVALLAGRSLVDHPGSISALYQNYFREQVAATGRRKGVRVIDVAGLMQQRSLRAPGTWYFRHDGHLNQAGHKIVAEILTTEFAK